MFPPFIRQRPTRLFRPFLGGRNDVCCAVVEPSTALMAGDIVVIEVDPWDPSDVTVEML